MKTILCVLMMSISVAAFAHDSVNLDSETTLINAHHATLIRTAETPQKVAVLMKVSMTRNVCVKWRNKGKTRRCIERLRQTVTQPDRVNISFKKAVALGGSERDVFRLVANQRRIDSENVIYELKAIDTVQPYSIIKKGILGYDSYSIELK